MKNAIKKFVNGWGKSSLSEADKIAAMSLNDYDDDDYDSTRNHPNHGVTVSFRQENLISYTHTMIYKHTYKVKR
jgi:hypothetical protein